MKPQFVGILRLSLWIGIFYYWLGSVKTSATFEIQESDILQKNSIVENPNEISVTTEGCESGTFFYSFNPSCQRSIRSVGELLLAEKNSSDLLALAKKLRKYSNLHPKVWYTAFTSVLLRRKDLDGGVWLSDPFYIDPYSFIKREVIHQAENLRGGECVLLDDKFGEDNLIENRLWYFREDIQVNSQHWLWHATYPTNPFFGTHADRRGELFLYYHHFLMQRYNAERLSNGLSRTVSFRLMNGFIMEEGYNSHLDDFLSQNKWDVRLPFTKLPESILDGGLTLNRTLLWRDRILNSIDQGTFVYPNHSKAINPLNGADKLGDLTEPSVFSPNIQYYGAVHGNIHILVSAINDPTLREKVGVMADSTVSMRDPIFYRWHTYINDAIYDRYKRTLTPYRPTMGDHPLIWDGVQLTKIEVIPAMRSPNGSLKTFWSLTILNLKRRLDFSQTQSSSSFQICAKHLSHEEFRYLLAVTMDPKKCSSPLNATVRIYMAPRYSESGKRFTMEEQRNLFFVMDIFRATVKPGVNTIWRNSSESSVTIPWEQNMGNLARNESLPRPHCGCGWPGHLLLPKGTPTGMAFDLFAMVTLDSFNDAKEDQSENNSNSCSGAPVLCGIIGKQYPDTKPMGYPFDRLPFKITPSLHQWWVSPRPPKDLDEYISFVPNMATTQITIIHVDVTKA